jgi:hypothetical protein
VKKQVSALYCFQHVINYRSSHHIAAEFDVWSCFFIVFILLYVMMWFLGQHNKLSKIKPIWCHCVILVLYSGCYMFRSSILKYVTRYWIILITIHISVNC